jgi:aspartokinase/homoserine dehydrogenase 1
VPVVSGFIGRTVDGHVTTLGRNGSDYTATIVARLLGAGTVTVWTDVLGVMTADPALVHEAAPVEHLSYDEALELSYFGTRMIHPRTIIPLRESSGVMWIRSSADPSWKGTRIDARGNPDPNRPTCVTSLERLTLIGLESRRTGIGRPIGGRIVGVLESAGIRVWMTSESTLGQTFAVIVPSQDGEETLRVIRETVAAELESGDLGIGVVLAPVSLVTLVAEAMGAGPNVAGRFYSAIGGCGINVHAVAMGATSRSISCVVDGDKTAQTVRAVHSAFNLAHTEMNILLLGKGIVGGSLLRQIKDHGPALERDHNVALRVVGVAGSAGAFYDSEGVDPSQAELRLKQAVAQGTAARDIPRLLEPFSRLPNPVLVDCTGADRMEDI